MTHIRPDAVLRDDSGAAFTEYSMVVAAVAVVCVVTIMTIGPVVAGWFTAVQPSLGS